MQTRSILLATFTVLLALSFAVPAATAQGTGATAKLTVKVTPPSGVIKPQIDNPPLKVDFTYAFDNQAFVGSAAVTSNVVVDLPFTCTNGVLISGPQSVVLPIPAGNTGTATGSASFQVSIPRTAPGLQNLACTLKAKAESLNGATPGTSETPYPFTVTADYYSVNQVKVASKLKQSGPQKQVPFEMEITNFGNARTQYTFELGTSPGGKWQQILPEVLLLDSPNTGQGSPTSTSTFTVATPYKNGWNNIQGSYQVVIKPSAADDPTKTGNPMTANMLVRVRGVYVPGLEPMVLLGAILGTALVLRLRKADE